MIFVLIQFVLVFFFQAEDGIRDRDVTGVQTCALPIWSPGSRSSVPCAGPGHSPKRAGWMSAWRLSSKTAGAGLREKLEHAVHCLHARVLVNALRGQARARRGDGLFRFSQGAAGLEAFGWGLDDHALALAAVEALAVVLGGGAQAFALAAVDAVAAAGFFLLVGGTGGAGE